MKALFNTEIEGAVFITAMLDNRRANLEGNYPVKIRVAFQSKKIYYSTGKYLTLEEWECFTVSNEDLSKEEKEVLKKMKSSLKKSSKERKEIKDDIKATFDKIEVEAKSLVSDGSFSFENLNRQLKKSTSEIINDAFNAKIKALHQSGQIGTKMSYQGALNSIEKFAGKSISFQIITTDWLKRYERNLIDDGKTYTTLGFYLRCLRAILNEAIRAGVLKQNQYPFGIDKYQIQTGESRKLALSKEQIKEVVNYSDGLDTTIHYRNLWQFSLLCNGANFTDILKLKYSDIRNGEISFIRQKTSRTSKVKKTIVATLTPTMESIIKTLGNPVKSPNNYIFPYLTGKETPIEEKAKVQNIVRLTNRRLSKIGKVLGIEGLNTYSARHSYTNILLQGGAPVALIADQLGHANIKTTQGYLAGFSKDERKKYSDLFSDL